MFFRLINWIKYWVHGKTIYRLHSPFVYEFAQAVLKDDRSFYAFDTIEARRRQLLRDRRMLKMTDHGAGSSTGHSPSRAVREITRAAAVAPRFGRLLFRTVQYFKPRQVLEMGSCTGIGSLYLAAGLDHGRFVTLEGDPSLAEITRESLAGNVPASTTAEVITGPFDDTLQPAMERFTGIDLAFIDGNHRKEPTLAYFEALLPKCHENTVLIFDDIYWSPGMAEAWQAIKAHPRTRLTIDLFRMGLVFFREENREVEHFRLYY